MSDITTYVGKLKEVVAAIDASEPRSRAQSRILRNQVNDAQTICQYIFSEVKANNRSLPE